MHPAVTTEVEEIIDSLLGAEKKALYERIGRPLPSSFRFNALRGRIDQQEELLRWQGFRFEPVEGLEAVFRVIHEPFAIGKSLSHFLGHIYLQDPASMIPALALDPKPGETVLDVCAAPGSKTTLLAGLMRNQGVLLANDSSRRRSQALSGNLFRMGVLNTAVLNWFGEQYGNHYFESFDRILVDPPCSALGTLHKSPEVLRWWTPERSLHLASIQKTLLAGSLKALRPGGVLVYSTCTLAPEENEGVIEAVLREFPVELEPFQVPGLTTRPGLEKYQGRRFSDQMGSAVRIYPGENESEGFFVARLRKTAGVGAPRLRKRRERAPEEVLAGAEHPDSGRIRKVLERFGIEAGETLEGLAFRGRQTVEFSSREMMEFPFFERPVTVGVPCLTVSGNQFRWTTAGSQWAAPIAGKQVVTLTELEELERFVTRQSLSLPESATGQILVRLVQLGIGYGVARSNGLRSRFPKAQGRFQMGPEFD